MLKVLIKLLPVFAFITGLFCNDIFTDNVYAAESTKKQLTVYIGKSVNIEDYMKTFDAEYREIINGNWSYSSSNNKIATVDKKGNITGVSEGKAVITLTVVRKLFSAQHNSLIEEKQTVKINVTTVPYDNSTDYRYLQYNVNNGKIEVTGLNRQVKNLVIPAQILGHPVFAIGDYAFQNNANLKTVKLLGNIKEIGKGAFINCTKLESAVLNDEITTIKSYAFSGCGKLKSVVVPENLKTLGSYAFSDCKNLKTIELGDKLKKIDNGVFWGCSLLESISLSDNINTVGKYAFSDCKKLKSVWLGKNVKKIEDYAFNNCNRLEKINLHDKIEFIGSYAFYNCDGLTELNLPDSAELLGRYAFANCSNLKKIEIPDRIKTIGDYCFSACDKLMEVKVNNEIKRDLGMDIFSGSIFEDIECAFIRNVTFHFTDTDWKNINLLLDVYEQMDIKDDDNDLEKIRKVHDWLVINISYSKKQFYSYLDKGYNWYEIALKKGFGICSLYSFIFRSFMKLLDIECIIVTSKPMDHAWNMVKLDDGCWYHIDVTWDDPGSNDDAWDKGWLKYANLLRDDEGIKSTGHHDWDESAPKANGTKYLNYFDINYKVKF